MVKAAFKMGKPVSYGTAIGAVFGAPGQAFLTTANIASAGTKIGTGWRTRFGTSTPPGAAAPGGTTVPTPPSTP